MTQARNQDGFALIEVIVSAAVLAIIALAVLAGIDGATASTARERARAVAASLAEQHQERARSMRFDELTKLAPLTDPKAQERNAAVTVDGVKYNVNTEVTFRVDSGTPTNAGCGVAGGKQNEYLRVVTTVTSPIVGGTGSPVVRTNGPLDVVKIESLVAPPVSGSLVVKVMDSKGGPVVGAIVEATAKSGRVYQNPTNAQGCALFVGVESGEYTVTATKSGFVDRQGKSPATAQTTVSPNLVNVLNLTYDQGVNLTVNVRTLAPGTAFSTSAAWFPSKAVNVSDNSADPSSLRTYTPATPSSTIAVPNVFPFASGYSFFTGSCAVQSPVRQTGMTNYFSQTNPAAVVIADPMKTAAQLTATVYQPALRVRMNSTSDLSGSGYKITAVLQKSGTETCADSPSYSLTINTWPSSGWGNPPGSPADSTRNWVNQSGTDFDPGLPFGTYKLCVQNSSNNWWSTDYANTATHRSSATTLIPTNNGSYSSTKPTGC